jgi:ABC-type uncharacterized transport system involved in gliding motility auxiliary subunit
MTKTVGRVLGPLGILFILFALASRVMLTGGFTWPVTTQLGLGVLFVAVYAATAFDDVRRISAGRGSMFVLTSAVSTVVLAGILATLNYVAVQKRVEWDLTREGIHTLAEQTRSTLAALTPANKITVTAFYRPTEQEYAVLEDLFRRYKVAGGDNFEGRFIDPYKDPRAAREFNITPQSPRIIVTTATKQEARRKDPTEEALTNAIAEVTRSDRKKVYFLTGHGEKSTTPGGELNRSITQWNELLQNEGYESAELNLLAQKDVPADAQVVLVAGPQSAVTEPERQALARYAEAGGRLVFMLDPGIDSGLAALASQWGAQLLPGLVLDPDSQFATFALTQEFSEHPLATPRRAGKGKLLYAFPDASGLRRTDAAGFEVTELFKTGANAWGENGPIDLTGEVAPTRDASDDAGPLTLGLASTKKLEGEKEFRAVIFGDSDFASDAYLRIGGNRDLAMNLVQWLAGQDAKISIRPPMRAQSTLANLTQSEMTGMAFMSLNILPLLLIGLGLGVSSLRKSR